MTYLEAIDRLRQSYQDTRTGDLPALNEVQIEAWLKALSLYPMSTVEAMVNSAMTRWKWFPTLAEVTQAMSGDPKGRALEAWGQIEKAMRQGGSYRGVKFLDPAAGDALRAAVGYWPRLCQMETASYEYSTARKTFLELYERYAATPRGGEVVMSGQLNTEPPYEIPRLDGLDNAHLLEAQGAAPSIEDVPIGRDEAASILSKTLKQIADRAVGPQGRG